jgi:hypothetical protein
MILPWLNNDWKVKSGFYEIYLKIFFPAREKCAFAWLIYFHTIAAPAVTIDLQYLQGFFVV